MHVYIFKYMYICVYVYKYICIQIDTCTYIHRRVCSQLNNFLLYLKFKVLFLAVKVPHGLTCLYFQIRLYHSPGTLVFFQFLTLQNLLFYPKTCTAFSANDALYLLLSALAQMRYTSFTEAFLTTLFNRHHRPPHC